MILMQAPSTWPFPSHVVPARFMPSGQSYVPDVHGQIRAGSNDVPALLGFGFYITGSAAPTLSSLSDVNVSGAVDADVVTWDATAKQWIAHAGGGGGGTPGSPSTSVQYNNSGAFAGTSLHYDGTGFSTPYVSTYVNASVLGAAIVAGGTGGTLGAGKTVTGTTGTGTKFQASVTVADLVSAAVVNNAGDGSGTPGPVTITGTTGTGTPFQATGTVDGAGHLVGPLTITVHGSYTVEPTTTGEAVTSDAGLVGATVDLTLAGGAIVSVDSISVAGAYTVSPTDPANEPVTGDSLTGAVLALGMNFAPSIVGGDSTRGLSFNGANPQLSSNLLSLAVVPSVDYERAPGVEIVGNSSFFGMIFYPLEGQTGDPFLDMIGVGAFNSPYIDLLSANGVYGALTPTLIGDRLGSITFGGRHLTNFGPSATLYVVAEENYDATHFGESMHFSTATVGGGGSNATDHLVIDGTGNTNILNGVLAVATPMAISALPASPVAGMIATVNDALTPTIGQAVASGGAASAVVCYGGTQWTVFSI